MAARGVALRAPSEARLIQACQRVEQAHAVSGLRIGKDARAREADGSPSPGGTRDALISAQPRTGHASGAARGQRRTTIESSMADLTLAVNSSSATDRVVDPQHPLHQGLFLGPVSLSENSSVASRT